MKKIVIVLAALLGLLVIALITIPIIFKEDIRKAVDGAIAEKLKARVYYDESRIGISMIRSFPNLSLRMDDFGIIGLDEFDGDTLVSISRLRVTIDLMSLVGSEQMKVVHFGVMEPRIFVQVRQDGTASYDIMRSASGKPESTASSPSHDPGHLVEEGREAPGDGTPPADQDVLTEEAARSLSTQKDEDSTHQEGHQEADPAEKTTSNAPSLSLESWEFENAVLVYVDEGSKMNLRVSGLDHRGSGNFSRQIATVRTKTTIENLDLRYDGVRYLRNRSLAADVALSIDLNESLYTLGKNHIRINDFGVGFSGTVKVLDTHNQIDLQVGGEDLSIRSILSLIPGLYADYLEGIKVEGTTSFGATIRGRMDELTLPHIEAHLSLDQARITHEDYPASVENIDLKSRLEYPPSGSKNARFTLESFSIEIDGNPLGGKAVVSNFDNPTWEVELYGKADLGKIQDIFPLEGTDLKGILETQLQSTGTLSDVASGNYANVQAEGSLEITGFRYIDTASQSDYSVDTGKIQFSPDRVVLTGIVARSGSSDFSLEGEIQNYLPIILGVENSILSADLDLSSQRIVLDELTGSGSAETSKPEATTTASGKTRDTGSPQEDPISQAANKSNAPVNSDVPVKLDDAAQEPLISSAPGITSSSNPTVTEAFRIPENISFTLRSSIREVKYLEHTGHDFQGNLEIKGGNVILNDTRFSLLGGLFTLSGRLNISGNATPDFDFDFSIKDLPISQAVDSLDIVGELFPIAEKMGGSFSARVKSKGPLDADMVPIADQIRGDASVDVRDARVDDIPVVEKILKVAKIKNSKSSDSGVALGDIAVQMTLIDGRVIAKPFTVNFMGQATDISGSHGIDGTIDYRMTLQQVDISGAGQWVNSALDSFIGNTKIIPDKVDVTLGIQGSLTRPKVRLTKVSPSSGSGNVLSNTKVLVKEKLEEVKEEMVEKLEQEVEKKKAEVKEIVEEKKEQVEKVVEKEKEKVKEKAKEKLKKDLKKVRKLF